MDKAFPDVAIRDAVFDVLDNIVVNGHIIRCYDTQASGAQIPDHYIIMSTQTAIVDKGNKCEDFWDCTLLLDITTIYPRPGNPGSRYLADSIADQVRFLVKDLQLDPASGLEIITRDQAWPGDLVTTTDSENVFRKLLRLSLLIK